MFSKISTNFCKKAICGISSLVLTISYIQKTSASEQDNQQTVDGIIETIQHSNEYRSAVEALRTAAEQRIDSALEGDAGADGKSNEGTLSREFGKMKLKIALQWDLLSGVSSADDEFDPESTIIYEITVEPAFRGDAQLRTETIGIRLGGAIQALSATSDIRVTFSEIFDRKRFNDEIEGSGALKWKTLLSRFRIMDLRNGLVFSSADLRKNLKPNQGIRLDLGVKTGLFQEDDHISGHFKSAMGISAYGESRFIQDIFKLSDTQSRFRYVAIKNKGTLNAGPKISNKKWLPKFLGPLRRYFTVEAEFRVVSGIPIFQRYPIDSMMIDLEFNTGLQERFLSSSYRAEDAIDQVLGNLRGLKFLKLFDVLDNNNEIAEALQNYISLSEQLAKEDENIGASGPNLKKQRVVTHFKGRIRLNPYSVGPKGKVGEVVKAQSIQEGDHAFLSVFSSNKDPKHYLVETATERPKYNIGFNAIKDEERIETSLVFQADGSGKAEKLLSQINSSRFITNDWSKQDNDQHFALIKAAFPTSAVGIDKLEQYFPSENQTVVNLKRDFIFSPEAFEKLAALDLGTIAASLQYFLENHPYKTEIAMGTWKPYGAEMQVGDKGYGEFIEAKARKLHDYFSTMASQNFERTISTFHSLNQEDRTFRRWLGAEYQALLLKSTPNANDLYGAQIDKSDRKYGSLPTLKINNVEPSRAYQTVRSMRNLLDRQDLDFYIDTLLESKNVR